MEKIACDAYRLFSAGFFLTPKTKLARLELSDKYTQNNATVINFSELGVNKSLRVMSKWVKGYTSLKNIKVRKDDGVECGFIDYIVLNGKPPEKIIEPINGKEVLINGIMSVLAVSSSITDTDVFGGNGDNCGIIFLKNNKTNEMIGAHIVKIDPGFSFNYDDYNETKRKMMMVNEIFK